MPELVTIFKVKIQFRGKYGENYLNDDIFLDDLIINRRTGCLVCWRFPILTLDGKENHQHSTLLKRYSRDTIDSSDTGRMRTNAKRSDT